MAHVPTLFQRPDKIEKPLYVVTSVFNSARFRSRWKLYEDFARSVEDTGAILYTVEVAFGERAFAVTSPDNPHHLQLRTAHELWYKENANNLGMQRLPADWSYAACIDSDIHFMRYDWADETIHQLQHFPIVQMFSQIHNLSSDKELMGGGQSFSTTWKKQEMVKIQKMLVRNQGAYPYPYGKYPGPPGGAFAYRREAWNAVGGLIDFCILGSADLYMAYGLIGLADKLPWAKFHPNYPEMIINWQRRAETTQWAERPIAGNVGVVPGLAMHYWHGDWTGRQYNTRNNVLIRNRFDPHLDLKRDSQGLYQLTSHNPQLRRDIQEYFSVRNEDLPTIKKG